ncbi:MAG: hypothetical protein KF819_32405 [Labilithrix sp.]|nr:hypothetical protein [Labilithrix sp.]
MRVRDVVVSIACVGSAHCGSEVVVGMNRAGTETSAVPAGGSANTSAGPSALLAVRRAAGDGHVAGGFTGCADANDAACDGWLATVGSAIAEEARLAAPGADHVLALALLDLDRVAGGARAMSGVPNAWVARRTISSEIWNVSLASDPTRASETRAIERAPDGTLVAAGNERLDALDTGWLARIGADGAILRRIRIGGTPSSSESTVDAVTVLPSGRIFVGGRRRQNIGGRDATTPIVLDYGSDFTFFNSKSGIGLDGERTGVVRTVLGERDHEITACAQVDDGAAIVRMEEAMVDVEASRTLTDPTGRVELGGCAVTEDGGIVLAGTLGADPPRPWAAKVDRVTLEPRWARKYETERGRLLSVAAAPGGGAVAVGTSDGRAYALAIDP